MKQSENSCCNARAVAYYSAPEYPAQLNQKLTKILMASLITSIDRVFSNKGKEWHGLARHIMQNGAPVDALTAEHVQDIFFPVIPLRQLSGSTIDGATVLLPDYKAVAADLRSRGEGIEPLGLHSEGYSIIQNSQIWEAVKDALAEFPHSVTTAGTLDGCRRIFISVQLADGKGFEVNGERFSSFLNFISSHDGTVACQAYDSNVRIVCNNTLNYSQRDAKHKLYVRHTKNAEYKLENTAAFIREAYAGRAQFANRYKEAMETPVSHDQAFSAIAGYVWKKTKKPGELSTRARNIIDGIMSAYVSGKGNAGQTKADLLNGFTEFYTHGDGTGQKTTEVEKMVSAQFGTAAENKSDFARLLLDESEGMEELVALGSGGALDSYARGAGSPVYMSGIARSRAHTGAYGERVAPVTASPGVSDFASLLSAPLAAKN